MTFMIGKGIMRRALQKALLNYLTSSQLVIECSRILLKEFL
jgi:hypothetical protein